MAYETVVQESVSEELAAAEPQVAALQAALAQVQADSCEAPDEYLDESTVPHGGE
jgi:hypothetical protein